MEVMNDGNGNRSSGGDSGGNRQQRGQATISNKQQHFDFT